MLSEKISSISRTSRSSDRHGRSADRPPGRDRLAERRTGSRPVGAPRSPLATQAQRPPNTAPGHVRLDGRATRCGRRPAAGSGCSTAGRRAMRADVELGIDDAIRLRVQHPPNAAAARTRGLGRPAAQASALRRRQRGIVRRLAWMFKHASRASRSALRAPTQQSAPARPQAGQPAAAAIDEHILLCHGQLALPRSAC